MNPTTRTLPNGLRIQTISMPGTNVVTALVLVGAGSRYETRDISGLSHFLEHMFFKGGKKYTNPKAVSEAIDRFGGEFNAFTGKEYAGYFVKSGRKNLDASLDVLSDMLLSAVFPPEEIEKERGVILEEMAMYLDMPMYQISWDFEELVFGDQPLGWDQIGTREMITTIDRQGFVDYRNALYVPENTVITLAGDVTDADIDRVAEFFPMQAHKPSITPLPFNPDVPTQNYKIREKKTEQYHISLGLRTFGEPDPRFPTLKVLVAALGGNMSSRMFQTVREEKGLCYSVRTKIEEFSDTGLVTTRAGVKLGDVLPALAAIRAEYMKIAEGGFPEEEIEKAKSYLEGRIDLSTEDTEEVAHHFAKNMLLYGSEETFDEGKANILRVDRSGVNALAQELFAPGKLKFAGIGPHIEEEKLGAIVGG